MRLALWMLIGLGHTLAASESLIWPPGELHLVLREESPSVSQIVRLVNSSSVAIDALAAETGCGCLSADILTDLPVPPNEPIEVLLRVTDTGVVGTLSKVVTVRGTASDGTIIVSKKSVAIEVKAPLKLSKRALLWRFDGPLSTQKLRIDILDPSVAFTGVEAPVDVAVDRSLDGTSIVLAVAPQAEAALGKSLIITTDSPHARFARIEVYLLGH